MRYYLDTNILIFVLLNENDEISRDVAEILYDPANTFYVSASAVRELIYLYKVGKIKHRDYKTVKDWLNAIEAFNIEIKPLNKHHLLKYGELEITEYHKDPDDHIIIVQAIADKIPLISSDRKFKYYTSQGLEFIFNKRQ